MEYSVVSEHRGLTLIVRSSEPLKKGLNENCYVLSVSNKEFKNGALRITNDMKIISANEEQILHIDSCVRENRYMPMSTAKKSHERMINSELFPIF